jgi:hypothetical protein
MRVRTLLLSVLLNLVAFLLPLCLFYSAFGLNTPTATQGPESEKQALILISGAIIGAVISLCSASLVRSRTTALDVLMKSMHELRTPPNKNSHVRVRRAA